MSEHHAVFRCAAGCVGDHSIWQPIYRCPTCGDLLQVVFPEQLAGVVNPRERR